MNLNVFAYILFLYKIMSVYVKQFTYTYIEPCEQIFQSKKRGRKKKQTNNLRKKK